MWPLELDQGQGAQCFEATYRNVGKHLEKQIMLPWKIGGEGDPSHRKSWKHLKLIHKRFVMQYCSRNFKLFKFGPRKQDQCDCASIHTIGKVDLYQGRNYSHTFIIARSLTSVCYRSRVFKDLVTFQFEAEALVTLALFVDSDTKVLANVGGGRVVDLERILTVLV